MNSWIYIFSQFTPEALVLELGLIFILIGGYAVFWIIRKRKFGVVDKSLPSGPVKAYLNELIGNAKYLKTLLFGVLSTDDREPIFLSNNSDLQKILASLEIKLDTQGKAIENLKANGVPLVANPPLQASTAPVVAVTAAPTVREDPVLKEKLNNLEARLAEYSIIEDDLANLKRIQQENAELRATLAQNSVMSPISTAPSVTVPTTKIEATSSVVSEPEPSVESEIVASQATSEPVFDSPEVKKPAKEAKSEAPLPNKVPPAADPGPQAPADSEEDDLVREFEKMLQG